MRKIFAFLVALAALSAECSAQSWELVKPDGLGFQVELPGKAEFKEESGDDGGKIRTYVVASPAAAYDVTVWDMPNASVAPEDVSQSLDNIRDRNLDGLSAKLRSETKIEINGHQARDVTADVMGMVWRGRMVIANNRIYQIIAIVSKAAERSETTEKYFASFKLTEPSPEPGKSQK